MSHRHQPFARSEPALRLGCQSCLTGINLSPSQNPHYAWVASRVSQASTFNPSEPTQHAGSHFSLADVNLSAPELKSIFLVVVLQTSTFRR
ncbi:MULTISPECIES: hypothetical protein [Providencia]|uniref:hypothetical protein n=1 Tax=Providencia TaxID=586 RepID=UPI001C382ABA|nr:hypothetical protein [Providencia sp. PROV201]EKT9734966.1 hypothetical protein [Proteus mirabilis]EKW6744342.1 hypothetical protein [Proteus mirabilis]EKX9076423.1 hypothetical protein [Proteus mirabilis]MBV2191663.1 hypothetical protein [Providencia rettgeri]